MTEIAKIRELRPREISTLRGAVYAMLTGYGQGRILISDGSKASAERLVKLDLVREADVQLMPPMGLVIECTNPGLQLFRERYNGESSSDSGHSIHSPPEGSENA